MNRFFNNSTMAFVLLTWLFAANATATTFSGKLVKVIDGDTVEVLHNGKAERIRLGQIDAPEQGQPFGQAAKRYVLDIAAQKIVTVQVETVDRYGRTVAEVFLPDGSNLNKEIVRSGYAWQYKRYSTDPEYGVLEGQARDAEKGLWQKPDPVPPWEWRAGMRQVDNNPSLKADFTCGSKNYCKEMASCYEAKLYLNECGLGRLDGDSDEVSNLGREQIELIIDNKVLEANLSVVENRVNFLLGIGGFLLAVFGIAFPLYQTNKAKQEVQLAINKMEERFDKLAHKELRKPEIECYYDGKPLKYSSIVISPKNPKSYIIFENIGDKQSSDLRIYAFFKNPDNLNFDYFFSKGGKPQISAERPEYDLVFPMGMSGGLNPKESLRVDYEFNYDRTENVVSEDKEVSFLFVVYYGVDEPIEIPFSTIIKSE